MDSCRRRKKRRRKPRTLLTVKTVRESTRKWRKWKKWRREKGEARLRGRRQRAREEAEAGIFPWPPVHLVDPKLSRGGVLGRRSPQKEQEEWPAEGTRSNRQAAAATATAWAMGNWEWTEDCGVLLADEQAAPWQAALTIHHLSPLGLAPVPSGFGAEWRAGRWGWKEQQEMAVSEAVHSGAPTAGVDLPRRLRQLPWIRRLEGEEGEEEPEDHLLQWLPRVRDQGPWLRQPLHRPQRGRA
jgi:hypothetical protein